MNQRIVLFGGAFDPPHNGHVAMAQAATDEINPDKVLWIPTAHPAHRNPTIASFKQRCDMLQLVTEDNPRWEVCPIEADREGPSYFIDTLDALITCYPGAECYVLIGEDQLANFTQWHQWQKINEQAKLLVMPRRGTNAGTNTEQLQTIFLHATPIDISSTDIRLHSHFDERFLPAKLNTYLKTNRYYPEHSRI